MKTFTNYINIFRNQELYNWIELKEFSIEFRTGGSQFGRFFY